MEYGAEDLEREPLVCTVASVVGGTGLGLTVAVGEFVHYGCGDVPNDLPS